MKIDAQQAYNVFLRPQEAQAQAAAASSAAASDFAAILGQASKAQPASLEELGQSLLPKFDLVGQLQAGQAAKASPGSPYGAAEDVESLLDLLDNYAQALANPQNTLKDLAPLADGLGLAAQGLGQASGKLSPDDPLKALASDTASVAMVEAMKFKRGDYI
jgi:hypothetical protein